MAKGITAGLLVAGLATVAGAHETWLIPSTFSARSGGVVRFDVSSGMAFPKLESPIRAERIAKAGYRLGAAEGVLSGAKPLEKSTLIRHTFSKDGVATVWLDLKPKDIELSDDKVAEYFDEIGATDDVRSLWAGHKGRIAWKESYTKHMKSFVALGDWRGDTSWGTVVGQDLEMVPVTSPFAVEAGGEFTVELTAKSSPLAGLAVGLLVEGEKTRVFRTTDASGRATFPVAKEGRAMLFAVRLRPAGDGRSWASDFCTMTFCILPPDPNRRNTGK